MHTNFLMPTVIGLTLSIVTAQATAASDWRYDEESDTVIFSYTGNSETHSVLRAENESADKSGTWYYDESNDYIVYSVNDSRDHSALTSVSFNTLGSDTTNESVDKSDTWYYDENSDYIVYNVNDTRDHSAQTIVSINSLGSDTTPAFLAQ